MTCLIRDQAQKLIKSVSVGAANRVVIDVKELAKGIYLMKIEVGGEKVRLKLAKK